MVVRNLVRNLDALEGSEPFDVCIIGSGPAGTTLGTLLAEHGIRTVILESGNSLLNWLADPRLKKLAEYEYTGDTNYPLTRTTGRLVGGNSNFWTGRCERFQPSDFETNPYTPKGNPWPIKYKDLDSYYLQAEKMLRVRGGKLSKYMPPRSEELPLPPSPNITALKKLMIKAGVVVDDSPTATPARGIRFFRFNKEILPRFLGSRCGILVSGVTVTRLIHDNESRIMGAEAKTLDGITKMIRAHTYVVACGGIQTPRLLLLSRSERFPKGIGNQYDRVGRGFNEHAAPNIYGKIRHNRNTLDLRHKVGRTHQFYEKFWVDGLGGVFPVFIQSWVFPHHLLRYRLQDIPRHAVKIMKRAMQPTLYMGATIEMQPVDENRVSLSNTREDIFGNPLPHLIFNYTDKDLHLLERTRQLLYSLFEKMNATDLEEIEVTWSRHHIGTCRMGDNPKTSVVDRNLKVHDCPNLYLCGSETFVTGSPAPPVLTITALAHRLGDHLISSSLQKI
ncbi:glucose-methanol-choline oxidoreductase [Nitrosococcus halophilus Nc 4]|uniref:Glucose-methanol-choline oxidoreductase n=1 Tax=Nitrosococcus halophilus (strain Nc4) TaxID=472759 RepID=D5C0M3_NITHN|nr:GMC family oxidoreductase [Nitrosococcus halophilus]ADE16346.1 glucose-methanol-choline oxidoreductase [Nitrosococcus halophilus Nc 4]